MARSKYRNVATVVDGVRYASKAEARRAQELKRMVQCGAYNKVERQPLFQLGDVRYRADFQIWAKGDPWGDSWVEEVKGFETPRFRLIKRLWRRYGPCRLVVLKRRSNEWACEFIEGIGHDKADRG